MSDDAIIEKIKKLLRMKRGGAPGEIENALALAAELARKHGIDLNTVDPDADAKTISHLDAKTAARIQDEYKYAALVCQNFFNVTVLLTSDWAKASKRLRDFKIVFIGTKSDQQIALYVFEFLAAHFRRCWNRRENRRLRDRKSFMCGLFQGLCQKLHLERKRQDLTEGEGLILASQSVLRDQYMKDNWPHTGKVDMTSGRDSASAKVAGWVQGRNTEIRGGLDKPAKAQAALPPVAGQMSLL